MIEWIETNLPNVYRIGWEGTNSWSDAFSATLYMTGWSFVIGGILGLLMGLFLVLTGPNGVLSNRIGFKILDIFTSIVRAITFIILLAILKGFTYAIVGTNLGRTAALIPLSAATFAFYARQVQVVFSEMDRGVIEAAQASGATLWDIIKIYLSEGLPELIRVSTVTLISLIGETAMAGAIGAGGLGYIAIYYGYNRSATDVTIVATICILILVFIIQFIGDFLTKKLSHK